MSPTEPVIGRRRPSNVGDDLGLGLRLPGSGGVDEAGRRQVHPISPDRARRHGAAHRGGRRVRLRNGRAVGDRAHRRPGRPRGHHRARRRSSPAGSTWPGATCGSGSTTTATSASTRASSPSSSAGCSSAGSSRSTSPSRCSPGSSRWPRSPSRWPVRATRGSSSSSCRWRMRVPCAARCSPARPGCGTTSGRRRRSRSRRVTPRDLALSLVMRTVTAALLLLTALIVVVTVLSSGWGGLGLALVTGGLPIIIVFAEFIKYFNFTVSQSPDGLRLKFGLAKTETRTVPPGTRAGDRDRRATAVAAAGVGAGAGEHRRRGRRGLQREQGGDAPHPRRHARGGRRT